MMTKFATVAFAALFAAAGAAQAGSIENLERERAIAIETLLSPEMTPAERHAKIAVAKSRLVDLERIVLRDTSLQGRATPAVKRAFDNYDLTFLVHASTEKDLSVMDHWLEQLGLTSQALTIAQRRRR
jgi:hypothetical protein